MPAYQVLHGNERRAGNLVYDVRDGHLHGTSTGSRATGCSTPAVGQVQASEPPRRHRPGAAGGALEPAVRHRRLRERAARRAHRAHGSAGGLGRPVRPDAARPDVLYVSDLPNGRYGLEIAVDPRRRLVQASRANDRVVRPLVLGGRPGARTVTVPAWKGVDTEAALREAPAAASTTRTFACVLPT